MMNIPILGLVENMAYYQCPDCGGKHNIFGDSHVEAVAAEQGLDVLARLPLIPGLPGPVTKAALRICKEAG